MAVSDTLSSTLPLERLVMKLEIFPPRARSHEDHSKSHHRRNPLAKGKGEKKGEQREKNELAAGSDNHGFGLLEHIDEGLRLDAEGNSIHNERQYDIDGVRSSRIERYLNAVYCGHGFSCHCRAGLDLVRCKDIKSFRKSVPKRVESGQNFSCDLDTIVFPLERRWKGRSCLRKSRRRASACRKCSLN